MMKEVWYEIKVRDEITGDWCHWLSYKDTEKTKMLERYNALNREKRIMYCTREEVTWGL